MDNKTHYRGQDIQVEPNNVYMDLHELRGKVLSSAYNAAFKESDYEEIQQYHSDAYEDLEKCASITSNDKKWLLIAD